MRILRAVIETIAFVTVYTLTIPLFVVFVGSLAWFVWVEEWIKEEWDFEGLQAVVPGDSELHGLQE